MHGTVTGFPSTYRPYATARLLEVYAAAPERLRAAVVGLSPEERRARPRPGKWSVVELALHVAESELQGVSRMRFALAQPGTAVIPYDQDVWAVAFDYRAADDEALEDALALFALLRRMTRRVLAGAGPDDWRKTVVHPEHGRITLRNLLELYADHGERHLAQIVALRALLGRPLDLPPLLDVRLY